MAALLAPVILGMAGIAVDLGFAMHERSNAANAADAAALAGAGVLLQGGDLDAARSAAITYAQKNGYDSTKAAVYIPPTSGPHTGDSNYVEVTITTSSPTFFMRALHITSTSVKSRAVAAYLSPPKDYALVMLDKTACPAYTQSGSSTLTINNGGALVNSSCNPSATQSGGSFIGATYLDYYNKGGWQLNNNATTSVPPEPVNNQLPDPLASLPRPVPCTTQAGDTPAGCVPWSPDSGGTQANPAQNHITASSGNLTLRPGVYWGGLNIGGTGSSANVTFLPGTYIFAGGGTNSGGFNYTGSANLSGSGVTFFNTDDTPANAPSKQPCGPFSITGGGTLNFTAPTSGTWKNMLFWQDNSCTQTFNYGGGSNTTAGVIYLPTAQLSVAGGGNLGAIQVIVDTFTYSGNTPLTINYTDYVTITPPKLALVE